MTVTTKEDELDSQSTAAADAGGGAPADGDASSSEAPVPSGLDKLKSHYSDRGELDDDALYGAAAEELGELRSWRKGRETSDKELVAILKSHPKIAMVLQYIAQGAPELEALSRVFDPEDLVRYEDEPDYEQWQEGKKKREQDMKESEERAGQYDLNYKESLSTVEAFCSENGLDEEAKTKLLDSLFAVYDDLIDGKVSSETLMLFHKGNTHDEDVADAAAQGKIDGRNEKIDVKKKDSIKGDALPEIEGGGGGATEVKSAPSPVKYKSAIEKANELIEQTASQKRPTR